MIAASVFNIIIIHHISIHFQGFTPLEIYQCLAWTHDQWQLMKIRRGRIDYTAHARFPQENGRPYVWFSTEQCWISAKSHFQFIASKTAHFFLSTSKSCISTCQISYFHFLTSKTVHFFLPTSKIWIFTFQVSYFHFSTLSSNVKIMDFFLPSLSL